MGAREQLLDLLVEQSYRYNPKEVFELASGKLSDTYIDCKPTTMRREAARAIAELFERFIPPEAEAIGGLTAGADPIAYAIRDYASSKPVHAFMVRKEAKRHGLRNVVEGPIGKDMKVVVVDDVVTTGGSTLTAIRACRERGLVVVAVIVLVDREEGGLEKIKQEVGEDVPVQPIFTKSELHGEWNRRQHRDDTNTRGSAAATR